MNKTKNSPTVILLLNKMCKKCCKLQSEKRFHDQLFISAIQLRTHKSVSI